MSNTYCGMREGCIEGSVEQIRIPPRERETRCKGVQCSYLSRDVSETSLGHYLRVPGMHGLLPPLAAIVAIHLWRGVV